jgi:hypothetical protein
VTQKHDTEASKSQNESQDTQERERKEKVLHTRVPMVLERELKELAKNLRVPVSNLVRTILQDALSTAEALGRVAEDELRGAAAKLAENRARLDAAAAVQGEALRASLRARDLDLPPLPDDSPAPSAAQTAPPPNPLDGVLGFQQMMLAVSSNCSVCGIALDVGEPAYLGVRATPGSQVIIGPECLPGNKEND